MIWKGAHMKKLIILRGNSGSGKTSVSKELQKRFGRNTMLISQDMVRREILCVKDGIGTKALPLLISLLEYGKRNSEITILEGILDSAWYRPMFQKAVEAYGTNIYAFYYDLPFEETLLRHETKPNRDEFGEEAMRSWWKGKDYLDIIPERILTKDISFADTVDMICECVDEKDRRGYDDRPERGARNDTVL